MGVKCFMALVLAVAFMTTTTAQTIYSFDLAEYGPVREDAGTISVCIRRSGSVADDIDIEVEVSQGPAISESDFNEIEAFSFESGSTLACQPITIINDNSEEGTETFTLEISSDVDTGGIDETLVTIIDDEQDDEEYYWEVETRTVSEASGTETICMRRTGGETAPSRIIGVSYSGTTRKDTDYTSVNSWSFASGSNRMCRTISITNDNDDEPTETIIITIDATDDDGDPVDVGNPASVTISITDDDDDETYSFALSSYTVSEDSGSVEVCMRRSGSTNNARTIQVSYTSGTAISGSDFITGPSFYFGSTAGERCNTISITDDDEQENTESFTISILTTGNTGIDVGNPSTTTVSIHDNDDEVSIEWAQTAYTFTESAGNVIVTVFKSGTSKAVTANVVAYNSGSIIGSDYQLGSSTIYIPASSTQGSLPITINDDDEYEGSESFTLTLTSATSDVTITQASTTVTITDNDTPTEPPPEDRLSDGEIAGIAIGAVGMVIIIIIIVIVLYYLYSGDGGSLLDMCFPKPKEKPKPELSLQQKLQLVQQLQQQEQLQQLQQQGQLQQLQQLEQLQAINNTAAFGNDFIL